ncbi:MAG: hypothetical protein G01um101493_335 [Microgenomates group bacterium Gr01-1014_93]|nr:MAG: hypothetical protein G01um101493_335 [Microgenomates group bacterium Gr01-1014_93]
MAENVKLELLVQQLHHLRVGESISVSGVELGPIGQLDEQQKPTTFVKYEGDLRIMGTGTNTYYIDSKDNQFQLAAITGNDWSIEDNGYLRNDYLSTKPPLELRIYLKD